MDSLLTPYLFESPFRTDRAIIPIRDVVEQLDSIESATIQRLGELIAGHANALTRTLYTALRGKGVAALQDLQWPLAQSMAVQVREVWSQGWLAGRLDGQLAIRKAIPSAVRTRALTANFDGLADISPSLLQSVAQHLDTTRRPQLPSRSIQAMHERGLQIAGDFSQDTLDDVRSDLLQYLQGDAGDGFISRATLEQRVADRLGVGMSRVETIVRTELTAAYNAGRLATFQDSPLVEAVRFIAITDNRTTEICLSRHGLIWPLDKLGDNQPPLHYRCRSTLSPVMPRVNPTHRKWMNDPERDGTQYTETPIKVFTELEANQRQDRIVALPQGWR